MVQKSIPVYADEATMKELEVKFSYIFSGSRVPGHFYKPSIVPTIIGGAFEVEGIKVQPFKQDHGYGHTLGFRFGDFAYSTDVHTLDDAAFDALKGIKIWVVDCVREEPHPTHSHLAQTLAWIERVKPERTYLTHMNQTLDYASLLAKLPAGVEPAYDGLILEC
jgi:phosphoribosyl 1,2-cyclic phosphate phosphodiesterase